MKSGIAYIHGLSTKEKELNLREVLPEACALSAVIHIPNASRLVFDNLLLQEHRGEHSCGIISIDDKGEFSLRRRIGSVREQFFDANFQQELPGTVAIGHNRYATQGSARALANIQPIFFRETRFGPFCIAHNGNIKDCQRIRELLVQDGVLFQSETDSELFGHMIVRAPTNDFREAVQHAARKMEASFSCLVLHQDMTIALRDRFGVRPLSVAKVQDGFVVCSENFTFEQFDHVDEIFDIAPGEMVIFPHNEKSYEKHTFDQEQEHFCIFEGIYFSDPRSRYRGTWHEDFRFELGKQLFAENTGVAADCVVPILKSGKHAALGFSEAADIPYREYFQRLHNPIRVQRRSFTSPTHAERVEAAHQKFHLREEKVVGKRVIVIDDSIVRATTMKIITKRLRKAGAKEVLVGISAPPITNICPFGMDFQQTSELVAYERSIESIRDIIGADQLFYLSLEGLHKVGKESYRCGTCSGCFGGGYPGI